MKKILLSESAKALVLAFAILVSYAGNIMAQATVSEPDANGVVTITTTEAGQIGQLKGWNASYVINVPYTNKFKVVGPINDGDVNALLANNWQKNLEVLDLGEAEIDHLSQADADEVGNWANPKGTFLVAANSQPYSSLKTLVLPKVTSTTQTEVPTRLFTFANDQAPRVIFQNLETLVIPEGYTAIGDGDFVQHEKLSVLELPSTLKSIGKNAFKLCRSLRSLNMPEGLKRVDDGAFEQNGFTKLAFPSSVEYLGHLAFLPYDNLLSDVYFQGLEAPECDEDVFGTGPYTGWGGFMAPTSSKATRNNYVNNGIWFTVLHYRADLSEAQKATYTDLTRSYSIPDLYLGENRMWPSQDDFNRAHGNNDTHANYGIVNNKNFEGQPLTEEQMKHKGILRFVLSVADAPKPSKTSDVILPVRDDDWWTLCVPFDMDAEEVAETFGENAKVYTLGEVVRNESKRLITLKFNKKFDTIKAHMPYLIKPSKKFGEGENPKFAMVAKYKIQGGSEQEVNVTAIDQYGSETDYVYTFVGNYGGDQNWIQNTSEAKECMATSADEKIVYKRPSNCYYLSFTNGKVTFKYQGSNKSGRWTPYSAIVTVSKANDKFDLIDDSFRTESGTQNMAKYSATSIGEWDETTGVDHIEIETPNETTDNNVYSMNGQIVRKNSTSLAGLAQGVYLVNGKKHIVK